MELQKPALIVLAIVLVVVAGYCFTHGLGIVALGLLGGVVAFVAVNFSGGKK